MNIQISFDEKDSQIKLGFCFWNMERGEEICNTSNNIIGISIHISQNEKSCDILYFSSKATNT